MDINKTNSYYLYDNKKNLIFDDNKDWIPLDKINKTLINATISTEDKKFYKHIDTKLKNNKIYTMFKKIIKQIYKFTFNKKIQ